jgi:hypothetical protein
MCKTHDPTTEINQVIQGCEHYARACHTLRKITKYNMHEEGAYQ